MAPKLHIWVRDLLTSRTARKKGLFSEQAQGEEVDISHVWPETPSSNFSFSSSRSAFSKTSGKASDRLRHVVLFVCGRHDVDIPTFPFKDFLEAGQPVAEKSADSFDSVGSASSFNSESSFSLDHCGPAFESISNNSDSECEDMNDETSSIASYGSTESANEEDASPEDAAAEKRAMKPRRSKGVSKAKQRKAPRRRTKKLPPMPVLPDWHVLGGSKDHKESKRVCEFMKTLGTKATMDKLVMDGTLRIGRLVHSNAQCSMYSGQYLGRDVLIKEVEFLPGTVQEVKVLTDVRFLSTVQHKHIISQLLCIVRDSQRRTSQAAKRKLVTVHPVHGPSMAYALKRFVFHDRCQGGKPKLRAILKVFSQVVDAVKSLHQDGIVHGGIRAESVQLTGGVHMHAVLSDFHLATRLKKDKVKLTSFMMGALGAVPPEMYEGVQVNGTRCGVLSRDTDMFCLGVLLWHAICRQAPFKVNKATQTQEPQSTFPLVIPNGLCKSVHFTNAESKVLSRIETMIRELTNTQPWDRPTIYDVSKEVGSMIRFLDSYPPSVSPQIKDLDPIQECDSEPTSQPTRLRVIPTPKSSTPRQRSASPAPKPPLPVHSLSTMSSPVSRAPSPPISARRGTVPPRPTITIPEARDSVSAHPLQLSPSLLPSPAASPLPPHSRMSTIPLSNHSPSVPTPRTLQTRADTLVSTPYTASRSQSPHTLPSMSSSSPLSCDRQSPATVSVLTTPAQSSLPSAAHTAPLHSPLSCTQVLRADASDADTLGVDGSNSDSPTSSFSGGSDWCPSEEGDVRVTASIHPNGVQDLFAPAPKNRPSSLAELLQQMTNDAEMFNKKVQRGLLSSHDQALHMAVRT